MKTVDKGNEMWGLSHVATIVNKVFFILRFYEKIILLVKKDMLPWLSLSFTHFTDIEADREDNTDFPFLFIFLRRTCIK